MPGRSAASAPGSTAAARGRDPGRLSRRAPRPGPGVGVGVSTAVAAACFRARLAGEPSPARGTDGPDPRRLPGPPAIEARGKCGRFGGRTSPPSRWGPIRADCVDRGVAAARGEQWSATIRRRAALAGHLAELSRAGRAPSNASTAVAAARLRPAAPASPARARVSCRLHLGYTGGPPGPARRSRAHLGRIMGT